MAHIRTIKPAFFVSETISQLTHVQRLAFIGLWTLADRDGRLEDKPNVIRVQLFPYETMEMDRELDALAAKRLIRRYQSGWRRYIEIAGWKEHQRIPANESKSMIPAPADDLADDPAENDSAPADHQLIASCTTDETHPEAMDLRKGREGKGRDPDLSLRSSLPLSLSGLEASGSDPDQTCAPVGRSASKALAIRTQGPGPAEVFAHYRGYHSRAFPAPKSGTKEWGQIAARLREGYSVADLCQAIDGYHRSPYHCGQNESGTKYLDLNLIVRTGSHVARGIELAQPQQRPPPARSKRETEQMGQMVRLAQGGVGDEME